MKLTREKPRETRGRKLKNHHILGMTKGECKLIPGTRSHSVAVRICCNRLGFVAKKDFKIEYDRANSVVKLFRL